MTLTAKQQAAIDAVAAHGSQRAAAQALNIDPSTLRERLAAAARKIDPAIKESMVAVGTDLVPALAWAKTKSKDGGTSYSVLLKPPQIEQGDILARIAAAFQDIPPAPRIEAAQSADADLLTIYPLADAHVGMLAYGKETGESYDTNIAVERIRSWVARAVAASPSSAVAVILDVGDLTHADDDSNLTPRSKHPLTVDSRHFRTLDMTIAALASAIECALQKHAKVIVRILPGNHNQTSYMAVMFALSERYRQDPRVEVQKVPGEFFVMEFGAVMLAAHHGHGGKPDRMVHFLADEYAQIWGRTQHRFLWTGHLHHMKAQDIGGMQHEQLRAITSRDAYAISKAYTARAQLQAVTLHRHDGEVQRVKIGASFRNG
jgi:hypothetical protein